MAYRKQLVAGKYTLSKRLIPYLFFFREKDTDCYNSSLRNIEFLSSESGFSHGYYFGGFHRPRVPPAILS